MLLPASSVFAIDCHIQHSSKVSIERTQVTITANTVSLFPVFPPSTKKKGGGGGGGRYNFSMRLKQIKRHIKGNQVRKGGEHPGTPLWGETLLFRMYVVMCMTM